MADIAYRVEPADLKAHLFRVTLTIAKPTLQQRVTLPVWIPGSYLVREFSKHLQNLKARQGQLLKTIEQLDKCSWQVACKTDKPLVLTYEVYARDDSVRAAWLDEQRGFFNGTSLLLRVDGHTSALHELELVCTKATATWSVATGLSVRKATKSGFGIYWANNYDELVDAPIEMGQFWSGNFLAGKIPHRLVVSGAPATFDGERLLSDAQKICETQIHFWHGPTLGGRHKRETPFSSYVFLLKASDDGYGGLEHRNSTALICGRKDLPRLRAVSLSDAEFKPGDGYITLLGLISHEYFHSWNVKKLRPIEFKRYDYARENYTRLLWFFEGFTSYFDDLLLHRAGLIDQGTYLKLIGKTINQVLQTPGRKLQSVADASFDAWIKYYRQDENTPNATVSYYTKGALIALCLDLTLRQEGKGSLDAVMRALWKRCEAGPMAQDDLLAVLQDIAQRSFAPELGRWVHGTAELPLRDLLQSHGVAVLEEPSQIAQQIGVRVTEGAGIQIKTVLRGGLAEQAGMAAGDEWLGIEVGKGTQRSSWRMQKLDDLMLYAARHTELLALVARDKTLLWLPLKLPRASVTWRLAARDPVLLKNWLGT